MPAPRTYHALVTALLLLPAPGCAGWLRGDLGLATSTTLAPGRQGVAFDADAAFGPEKSVLLPDLGVHGKVTQKTGSAAVSLGLIHIGLWGPVGWYALGSLSALELGSSEAKLSLGSFGPAAEAGLLFAPSLLVARPVMITVGTRVEYDLHFTSQPHEGFWSITVGAALGRAP